jgi:hypothetical protein
MQVNPDKNYCTTIISCSYHNCPEIEDLITSCLLTDCLDLLENLGYAGDTALFMLAYLQGGIA